MAGLPAGPAKGPAPAKGPDYSSALYNPSQTLSGQQLGQAASQVANLQTQGPISQLAAQIAKQQAQGAAAQKQTFGYYMQLAQDAQRTSGAQAGINAGLTSQLQGIGNSTQQQLAQFGQQAQGGAVGRAAALGLDGGSQSMLAAQTAQQRGVGALNAGAFQAAGANQGANYAQHAAGENQTIDLRGQERLGDIGRATQLGVQGLQSKIGDLQAKKGALTATALGQLRQGERNYQIANAGLGIKAATLRERALNDQAKNALTASGQSITIRGQDLTHFDRQTANAIAQGNLNLKAATSGSGGAKPLSQVQQNKLYGVIDTLPQAIHALQQPLSAADAKKLNLSAGTRMTKQQIVGILGRKYDPIFIQAAYQQAGWGHITPYIASKLYAAGLRGNHFRVARGPATPAVLRGVSINF